MERLLGSGGLGEVWEVEHRVLGTRRALKVLHNPRGDLLQEGRVQARLQHPNVLPVLDAIGDQNGIALVLPLVRGPTLGRLLQAQPLTQAQARALALGIASGLAFAHRYDIVHRDLKPGNILIDPEGSALVPRIADFGLAGKVGDETAMGSGTPGYAAPEQLAGDEVGPASDWWSFGVVLYQMVMGERPFLQIRPGAHTTWIREPPLPWQPVLAGLLNVDPKSRLQDGPAIISAIHAVPTPDGHDPLALDGVLAGVAHALGSRSASSAELTQTTDLSHAATFQTTGMTRNNLPPERERLIGRGAGVHQVSEHLRSDDIRVVTITGAGGVGKTRLAQTAGRSVLDHFDGGVWMIDLTTVASVGDLHQRLGAALELPLPDDAHGRLSRALNGQGQVLLILDSAEVALPAVREAVGPLLDACADLRVLLTSREPVRLHGETLYVVDVLRVPEDRPHTTDLAAAEASPAVQLFVARARYARSDFALNEDNARDVNQLVRLLDGLPLALELAAARVRVLPPSKLVARMSRRFDLLIQRKSSGDVPIRQRTLRASLEASWESLDEAAQDGLAQLGVFRGSPTVDDVQAVVKLADGSEWIEDVLETLVDKSLLRVRYGAEPRFELLASIRAFCAEKLSKRADTPQIRQRHAQHFARWGQGRLRDVLGGHGGTAKGRRLLLDRADLLGACQHSIAIGDPDLLAPIAEACWALLERTGPLQQGLQILEQAVQIIPDNADLLRCLGAARLKNTDRAEALIALEHARALYQQGQDSIGEAECHNSMGLAHLQLGALDKAEASFEIGATLAEELEHPRIQGIAAANRVLLAWGRGDLSGALSAARRALPLHERAGDTNSIGRTTGNLAVLEHEAGALDTAEELYRQALVALRATGDTREEGLFLGQLGLLRTELGRLEEAGVSLQRSLRLVRRVGDVSLEAVALGNLGVLYGLQQDWDKSHHHHLLARELHLARGDARSVAIDTANLGSVALERGDHGAAATYLDDAVARAQEIGDRRGEGAFSVERARLHLAQGDLERAEQALDRAQERLEGAGGNVESAKLACARVALLLAKGSQTQAQELLDRTLASAREMGVRPGSALARALERVGGVLS
ncbi:MAG: protein kinase [Myxococcota bacterium]